MKKFLLVAVAALAVVACKKDDNNNGGEQPAPQETNPYIVNFEYPKTIITQEGAGVSTLTHTVTDRLLREVTYKNTLGANETISFSYNSENYLTKIEKKTPGVPTATLELFYNSKKKENSWNYKAQSKAISEPICVLSVAESPGKDTPNKGQKTALCIDFHRWLHP